MRMDARGGRGDQAVLRRGEALGLGTLLTKQRGVSVKKKSMLTSRSLWDPGDGGSIASVGCSRRGGMCEGTTILPWQQSGLESSLAVPATFYAIYMPL